VGKIEHYPRRKQRGPNKKTKTTMVKNDPPRKEDQKEKKRHTKTLGLLTSRTQTILKGWGVRAQRLYPETQKANAASGETTDEKKRATQPGKETKNQASGEKKGGSFRKQTAPQLGLPEETSPTGEMTQDRKGPRTAKREEKGYLQKTQGHFRSGLQAGPGSGEVREDPAAKKRGLRGLRPAKSPPREKESRFTKKKKERGGERKRGRYVTKPVMAHRQEQGPSFQEKAARREEEREGKKKERPPPELKNKGAQVHPSEEMFPSAAAQRSGAPARSIGKSSHRKGERGEDHNESGVIHRNRGRRTSRKRNTGPLRSAATCGGD